LIQNIKIAAKAISAKPLRNNQPNAEKNHSETAEKHHQFRSAFSFDKSVRCNPSSNIYNAPREPSWGKDG
jgi:hypothetical protein